MERKNKNKIKAYDKPRCKYEKVIMEGSFCTVGSVEVKNPNEDNGRINSHIVNADFTGGDFSGTSWEN